MTPNTILQQRVPAVAPEHGTSAACTALNAIGGVIPRKLVEDYMRRKWEEWLAANPPPEAPTEGHSEDDEVAYDDARFHWDLRRPTWMSHFPDEAGLFMNNWLVQQLPPEAQEKIATLKDSLPEFGNSDVMVEAFGRDPFLRVFVGGHWHYVHVWDEALEA